MSALVQTRSRHLPRRFACLAALLLAVALGSGLVARGADAATPLSSLVWSKLSPAGAPPAMRGATLSPEPAGTRLLLFGGQDEVANSDRTWAWEGSAWTALAPATSPPAAISAPMTYDAARGKTLLWDEGTWRWDGSDWSKATPATSPPDRTSPAFAYDGATGRTILFSGATGYFVFADDTWSWDGTNWTQLSPAHVPAGREGAAMAYDPATGQLVLFGGETVVGGGFIPKAVNETWVWTGSDWKELTPATSPPAQYGSSMVYDAAAERLILYGGPAGDEMWAWDGTTWEKIERATGPSPRNSVALGYDAAREQLILFGGESQTGGEDLDDTWAFGLPLPPAVPVVPGEGEPTKPGGPGGSGGTGGSGGSQGSGSGDAPPSTTTATSAPATCRVPNLRGTKLKVARRKIAAAHCKPGKVTKARGTTARSGKVRAQSPRPGRTLAAGAKVNVRLTP